VADEKYTTDRAPLLRNILEAVVERRNNLARSEGSGEIVIVAAAEIMSRTLLPRWQHRAEAAARDGVMESLYASIREEGWRAFADGGIKSMHAMADRACGDDDYLSAILDYRWDGIGIQGKGIWVA
jgi:hypothetical protein